MAAPVSPTAFENQLAHIEQSKSASIIAVNVVLPLIATVFIVPRIVAQKTKGATRQVDDCVIIVALLVTYILCIEIILYAHFGMGQHMLYILKYNPSNLPLVLKAQFAIEITWNLSTYFVKLSIILLLGRLFASHTSPRLRLYLHLVHAFLLLWTTASILGVVFQCRPMQSYWDPLTKQRCPSTYGRRIVATALNTFTDVILLSLPLRPVWQLRLPAKQKLAVGGMFMAGISCLAASAVRLHYFIVAPQDQGSEHTYTEAASVLWAAVEPCAGIICACLPLLEPLVHNRRVIRLSNWLRESLFKRRKEADTWWHPPPEEFETDDRTARDVESGDIRTNSDRTPVAPLEHRKEVKGEFVSVTEITEGTSSRSLDRC